jgi:hypothetical protein
LLIGSSHAHWTCSAHLRYNFSEFFSSLLDTTDRVARELIDRPDYGTAFEKELATQALPDRVAAAAAGVIEDAHTAAAAACIVFAHSMLDAAVEDYCRVSTMLSLDDWKEFVIEEKITLAQAAETQFDSLLAEAIAAYLKRVGNKSLRNKIEILQRVCKPGSANIVEGYHFDGKRIDRFDGLRHDIVHKEALGSRVDRASTELEFVERTNVYLSALITHRYGLVIGPQAIEEATR